MNTTLAFDVYGTLIDPFGVSQALQAIAGEKTPTFAQMWRDKQLESLDAHVRDDRALEVDPIPFGRVAKGEVHVPVVRLVGADMEQDAAALDAHL